MCSGRLILTIHVFITIIETSLGVENRTFPSTFKFGVATAAYQVEGAWNTDGKGSSIWDYLTHTRPELIDDRSNGDTACNSYHKPNSDTELLKDLGVDFYRFSISWSRILPSGYSDGEINQFGVDYYNTILDNLQESNIEAMVTLYHWDLPQRLQEDLGGWVNESLVDIFANYSRLAFQLFGDRVQTWTTFNEPHLVCQQGYESGSKAPAIESPGDLLYLCGHVVLKAHAKAYHIYDEEFREKQGGKISIVLNSDWFEPSSYSEVDLEAAERMRQFYFGWFAHPIFHGNYPQIMIDRIADRSFKEGFNESRLPSFTKDEIDCIKGTHDYIGLNHYTTQLISWREDDAIGEPSSFKDISVDSRKDSSWGDSASSWLKIVPWGIRNITKWIDKTYNNSEIVITENGVSDKGNLLNDDIRINYYRDYLSNILEAIYEDQVNITGYTAWSLMDNFEWNRGYTEKFGMYSVDFEDSDRPRTPKASTAYYKNVIATKCLVDECVQSVN